MEAKRLTQKEAGAYYTPDLVVHNLVRWVVRNSDERLLDPSCGDGRFIAAHKNSVGIEQDIIAGREAIARAPSALVHEGDFFAWASNTNERFECAAGNPPFIRYQTFKGELRDSALSYCARQGAVFSGLASSWAPFLVATASLLRFGGRMGFVVPAEIGHAPYSAPLLNYLVRHFAVVHVVAVKEKLFPDLSEDCWLLYAEGFGSSTDEIRFTAVTRLRSSANPPREFERIPVSEWRTTWKQRLRPFLISAEVRLLYQAAVAEKSTKRLGDLASVGIGYVTGANDFFHLRPSEARRWGIPASLLQPSVRNSRALPASRLTSSTVARWNREDEQMLLLRLGKDASVPRQVRDYLDSEAGWIAREAYKCRVRQPWYSVPDVQIPNFFLSYMSGKEPSLVRNDAGCTCTNSVHSVRLRDSVFAKLITDSWTSPFVRLSCELEGHPLGGGMLKLEPGEATQIVIPTTETQSRMSNEGLFDAVETLRGWRHYGTQAQ